MPDVDIDFFDRDKTLKLFKHTPASIIKDDKTEKQVINDLKKENQRLKDEVDSLWMMLDEMTKTDIENWSSILDELQLDVASRALMISKKKADC